MERVEIIVVTVVRDRYKLTSSLSADINFEVYLNANRCSVYIAYIVIHLYILVSPAVLSLRALSLLFFLPLVHKLSGPAATLSHGREASGIGLSRHVHPIIYSDTYIR